MTHREFAEAMGTSFSGSTMWRHAPSRERLHKVATVLADADLDVVATNDVFWDSIKSIEPAGVTEVYDATVLGVHNFIANGISLAQLNEIIHPPWRSNLSIHPIQRQPRLSAAPRHRQSWPPRRENVASVHCRSMPSYRSTRR